MLTTGPAGTFTGIAIHHRPFGAVVAFSREMDAGGRADRARPLRGGVKPPRPEPRHDRKDLRNAHDRRVRYGGHLQDKHQLAADLAARLMAIEKVPDIPMFRRNTAGFVHGLPAGDLSNVDGASNYVRVQVLTNAGALDRDKQLAVVSQFTHIVADAAGEPGARRAHLGAPDRGRARGWGLSGHANTNDELVAAARKQIAELQAKAGGPTS